jgi:uncharacterized protein (TIGR00730 family)
VFCGSSTGRGEGYADAARQLGRTLAERDIGLVYGGASVGTMGVLADAALAAGGEVVGVIPQHLIDREVAHDGLTELRVVETMHERKALMADLSGGFIALPGGAGTMDELFEAWTWAQLGLHAKPIGILDVAGFYAALQELTSHMVAEGFLQQDYRDMLRVHTDPGELVTSLTSYKPPSPKWSSTRPSAGGPGDRRH